MPDITHFKLKTNEKIFQNIRQNIEDAISKKESIKDSKNQKLD